MWQACCYGVCTLRIRSVDQLIILNFTMIMRNHDEQRLGYRHHYHISDVQTGVSILHGEQRQGDQVTGSYSQLAPSGEVRSVYYEVRGGQGYRAVIIQRTANSRVHQALEFERKQALQALPLAKPVAFVI
ncbi:LOW QUALITY PROTEIN: uncharacterized protein LOC108597965 [Drosophila busckii]|uniref:LOW QUALITY PROTEIN: uncharacterized protein LOC108597965 n=1 Tax=Drosophila busckii TaxID=30019 RepID=UPI00083EB9C1|nr:LOW QUALITY PROTEIN: uncharacterized protein LOC108597965 [Drosophila busckii]